MKPQHLPFLFLSLGALRLAAADSRSPAMTPAAGTPAAAHPVARVAAPAAASRGDSSIAPQAGFDAFRVVPDRNIFNPNRTGRRERTEEAPRRVDTLSLVGTMESDQGLRAFFDGSDSAWRKARRVGDAIDRFQVAGIAANAVTLERDGKTTVLHVGDQLRRAEGADWTLVAGDVARTEAAAAAAAADSGARTGAAPAIPANASDALRRLMEARAKQLKQ